VDRPRRPEPALRPRAGRLTARPVRLVSGDVPADGAERSVHHPAARRRAVGGRQLSPGVTYMSRIWVVNSSSWGWVRSGCSPIPTCHPCMTASPVPTFRTEIAMYTAASVTSTSAPPPGTVSDFPSWNWICCSGSCAREFTGSGRCPASSDRSAMRADRSAVRAARSAARADRFPERTDAKVATARTRVPAAVASEATVAHSITVIRRSLAGLTPRDARSQPGPEAGSTVRIGRSMILACAGRLPDMTPLPDGWRRDDG
jgi:hypothetical protein